MQMDNIKHERTDTEKRLSDLCNKTFLNLWSYTSPFKEDGKEMCDVIAIFENHIFIFLTENVNLNYSLMMI